MAEPESERPVRETREHIIRQLAPYLALGWQLSVTICMLGGIGWLIDSQCDSSPIGLLVGLIVGASVGLIQFFRTIGQLSKRP
ncbi:MAG: AtpZ/AtpI family protein [Candidatus Kapabacteria bacterium]|nr:AtpZ/AtpI family protein [Candidatus Kapabacteria bacterium]